jgi:hypothetical protein
MGESLWSNPGFEDAKRTNHVHKLSKTFYGLKQAMHGHGTEFAITMCAVVVEAECDQI